MKLLKVNLIVTTILVMFFAVSCNGKKNNLNYNANISNLFSSWDNNSDGVITWAEFHDHISKSGFFNKWDLDGNGELLLPEWNKGVKTYFGTFMEKNYGSFSDWNENNDGVITKDEFDKGIFHFVDHNSNGKISKKEFDHWFSWWGSNSNKS